MGEIVDHSGLRKLAEEIVNGSWDAVWLGQRKVAAVFWQHHDRDLNPDERQLLGELFPGSDNDNLWKISPYGVEAKANEDGDRKFMRHGEFIGGIAVACGIEPSTKEIETVIFHIGLLMGELKADA